MDKPDVPIHTDNIPNALRDLPQWIAWRWELNSAGTKYSKIPYQANHPDRKASCSKPAHWAMLADAKDAWLLGEADGIGFVFSESDQLAGVDLDDVLNEQGEIEDPRIRDIVERLRSYTERSPSGRGLHIIVRGELPDTGINAKPVEMYDRGRYFTVTGDVFEERSQLRAVNGELDSIYRETRGSGRQRYSAAGFPEITGEARPLESMGLPADLVALITTGDGIDDYDDDHSYAVWSVSREMLECGASPEEVLIHLANPENYLAEHGALSPTRRDGNVDSGMQWLWQYVVGSQVAELEAERDEFTPTPVVGEFGPAEGAREARTLKPHGASERIGPKGEVNIEPRPWVLGNQLMAGAVTALCGDAGTGKSLFTMRRGLSVATGLGLEEGEPTRIGNALIINNEEPLDEMYRRLYGLCKSYGISIPDLDGKIFFIAKEPGQPAVRLCELVDETKGKRRTQFVRPLPFVDELKRLIEEKDILYLGLDPFISLHRGCNENDNSHMEQVLDIIRGIAAETRCCIDLVHHTHKSTGKDTESNAGNLHWGRGASALGGAVRLMQTLSRMSEKTGERFSLQRNEYLHYVRLDGAKNNLGPLSGAHWFRKHSFDLENGTFDIESDTVGVVRPVAPDELVEREGVADAEQENDLARAQVEIGRVMESNGLQEQSLTALAKDLAGQVKQPKLSSRRWRDRVKDALAFSFQRNGLDGPETVRLVETQKGGKTSFTIRREPK